jgi:hypothetical protein
VRSIDFLVESAIEQTPRVLQLSGMFDVPVRERLTHRWEGQVPIDEKEWNVGLVQDSSKPSA